MSVGGACQTLSWHVAYTSTHFLKYCQNSLVRSLFVQHGWWLVFGCVVPECRARELSSITLVCGCGLGDCVCVCAFSSADVVY